MKIRCDLRIQNLQSAASNIQPKLHKSCMIGLYRPRPDDDYNDLSKTPEIILTVESKTLNSKYRLKRIETYTKFINEGKATLKLADESIYLMLSNCPALTLINFVSFLNAKMSSDRTKHYVPIQKENNKATTANTNSSKAFATRLLERAECNLGPSHLKNISPLCQQDLNVIMQKKSLQRSLESPIAANKPPPLKLDKKMSFSSMVQLTSEQKELLNLIKEGKNVFFTGSGGTGKSFLLNLAKKCFPIDSCFITASTGCAAALIGGLTLHAFAGFTLADDEEFEEADVKLKRICEKIVASKEKLATWKKCKHLIIDEISMIDAQYFDVLEAVARSIKNNDLPFGGIQLIICGDFLQLPPVSKHGCEKKKFCFQAKSWSDCIDMVFQLTQIKRQKDPQFIGMLEEIRFGNQKTIDLLENSKSRIFSDVSILPTRLCTHKDDVEFINQKELDALDTQMQIYKSIDEGDLRLSASATTKLLNFICPAREELRLKVGAQVMLVKNLDVLGGLVNGARGCVVRFDGENGRAAPVVRFMDGQEVTVRPDVWSFKVNAAGSTVTRRQLPLQLAWAMSIHKSQGMTLDCVEISLSRVFEFGQAYVALSRAKSLDSLRIVDFDPSAIKANEIVIKFYQSMSLRKSNKLFVDEDDD